MSIYDKASLIQIPSGYKAGELYSVIPNSGAGDFTHTRNGTATRVNSQGLIETVNANVPRLDYPFIDGVVQDCPHLLLEPQRTNYAPYSEDFNNWGDVGTTITPNAIISPNGTLDASKLVSTTNNWRKSSSFTASSGVTYTFSIYAKLDTSTSTTTTRLEVYNGAGSLAANYNLSNETISNSGFTSVFIERLENDWYRIGGTYTAGGTNNILYVYPSAGYGTAGTMYFWAAQQEAGTYASSYISTNGSPVTRLVDQCEIASGLEDVIGQTEGTFFIDFEFLYETTTDSSTDAFRDYFALGNTADLSEAIYFDNFRSQFRVFIAGSGMTTISIGNNSTGASQPNTRYKLAVKYKTGDCKAYLNGSLLGSSTGTVNFASVLNGIFFSYNSGSRPYKNQKKVYGLMMFKEALSDSELETITSYSSFNSMATALGYKII